MAENYPDLKADANFRQLQAEIADIENKIFTIDFDDISGDKFLTIHPGEQDPALGTYYAQYYFHPGRVNWTYVVVNDKPLYNGFSPNHKNFDLVESEKPKVINKILQYAGVLLKDNNLISEEVKNKYGAEKNKLFPTDVGVVVTDFLIQNFENIMQYSFTASVEDEFDQIAAGKKAWNDMIAAFYSKFHNQVEKVSESEGKSLGQRSLGIDPKSGKTLYARIGPFGPMVQLGEKSEKEEDPKPKYASLLKGQTIQTISFDEAIKLFDLPRKVGDYEGEEVVAAIGRFGPYLRHKGKFTSIKKTDNEDPLTISLERSIELIKLKIQADKDRIVANFEGNPLVQVLNGRYGFFIQISPENSKKINVKIPKDTDPKTLSREDCLDLMENQKKK